MKIFIIITILVISIQSSFAGLDDVKTMTQISPGVWDVSCSNAKPDSKNSRATTEKILNVDLCPEPKEESKCYIAAASRLQQSEINDEEEMHEIIEACRQGTDYTHKCIESYTSGIPNREINERHEILPIINTCLSASEGVDKCIDFGLVRVNKLKKDNLKERTAVVKACANASVTTLLCLKKSSKNLKPFELDDIDENAELITACGPSHLEIDTCIELAHGRTGNLLSYDQRKEAIAIVNKCMEASSDEAD